MEAEAQAFELKKAELLVNDDIDIRYTQRALDFAKVDLQRSLDLNNDGAKAIADSEIEKQQLQTEKLALAAERAEIELKTNRFNYELKRRQLDVNQDLIADTPEKESEWIDPDTIKFSYLATEQDHYESLWAKFAEYLSKQCGLPVEFVKQDSADSQLSAIQEGTLHVAGVNSGSVPLAVNNCGFVPAFSFGSKDQLATYTMKIIAKPDSMIKDVGDIRGHRLALNNPTSNSGWKAPMVLLLKEHKMTPLIDYDVVGLWVTWELHPRRLQQENKKLLLLQVMNWHSHTRVEKSRKVTTKSSTSQIRFATMSLVFPTSLNQS